MIKLSEKANINFDILGHSKYPKNVHSILIPLFLGQVFDGHGGKHAADFVCHHLPRFIVKDEEFPKEIERVISSAFLQTDNAFAEACSLDAALASGTTALAALVIGRLVPFQFFNSYLHLVFGTLNP